jgi:hypothetical protein
VARLERLVARSNGSPSWPRKIPHRPQSFSSRPPLSFSSSCAIAETSARQISARCPPERKEKELGRLVAGCLKVLTQPNLSSSHNLLSESLSREICAAARG